MFDFKKLISPQYLFKVDTILMHRSDRLFLVIGIALAVIGVVALLTAMLSGNQFSKRLWQRVSAWAFTIGVLEIIWYGFRYENITALGTHAVALGVLLIGLIWLIPIVKYRFTKYPEEIRGWEKEQVKQKYLQMNR